MTDPLLVDDHPDDEGQQPTANNECIVCGLPIDANEGACSATHVAGGQCGNRLHAACYSPGLACRCGLIVDYVS